MFRKITSAINSALTPRPDPVETLTNMGFDRTQARQALTACNNDVDRAAELLLASSSIPSTPSHHPPPITTNHHRPPPSSTDDDLRRALEQSALASQNTEDEMIQRAMEESLASQPRGERNEAMNRAAVAAMERATAAEKKWGTNAKTKPKKAKTPTTTTTKAKSPPPTIAGTSLSQRSITLPPQLASQPKDERIVRCAGRIAPHPRAVDTLLVALRAIRDDPTDGKYRTIDTETEGFRETLRDVPGTMDLLMAMNFAKRGNKLALDPGRVDVALLWVGISALEEVRGGVAYKEGKRKWEFEKGVREVLNGVVGEEEERKRGDYKRKLSSEPEEGQNGALLTLHLSEHVVKRRRFDGDDILMDVLHWMGTMGSVLPTKVMSGEWCLMDINQSPPVVLKTDEAGLKKTLQWVGCWPSGRIELRPGGGDERERSGEQGDSRGLAAGV